MSKINEKADPIPDRESSTAEELLSQKQLAAMLGVSQRTVEGWRVVGGGVPYVRLNRRLVRYRLRDVKAWLEEHLQNSTSEAIPQPGARGRR